MPLKYHPSWKKCGECGKKFYKKPTCSVKEWVEKTRFCSRKCCDVSFRTARIGRLSKFNFKNGHSTWNKGRSCPETSCDRNGMWSSSPGYSAIHKWINAHYIKIRVCANCGRRGKTQWAKISKEYTRNIRDYRELCHSCHTLLDKYGVALKCD